MRRLLCVVTLALSGCASASRQAVIREQELRARSSPVLLRAARSSDVVRRAEAVLAMSRIQSPRYVETLAERLNDDSAEVRTAAIFALGQLGLFETPEGAPEDPELAPARSRAAAALRPLLKDGEKDARAAAHEALGKTGSAEDEPALIAGLADPAARVRAQAALGLFRLRYLKRIPAYSEEAVRALTKAFSDLDAEARWRAVYAFSRFPEPRAAEALAAAVRDADGRARLFAARAIGLVKDLKPPQRASALAGVGALLNDADPMVRAEAVKALGALGLDAPLPDGVYADPSPHVRAAAADALAASGKPELAGKLDLINVDGSPLAAGQVLLARAKLAPAAAARALEKARQDPHWWARSRAYLATAEIAGGVDALAAGVKDPDTRVASAALEALAKIGGEKADAAVEAALADPGASLEMAGTAADAAAEKKSPRFLAALRQAYERPLAREFPELADSIVKAARAIVEAHPDLKEKPILPRPLPKPALAARLEQIPPPSVIVLETDKGEIELTLAPKEAPLHVAAFLDSARKGLYDGTIWHRVVTGFVVQGGDPRGSGWGDAGFSLRDEINTLPYERGALGMPKAGKDTGGCQLFITHIPTPHLDGRYTVFGRVTRGMDVVDRLEPGDVIKRARILAQ